MAVLFFIAATAATADAQPAPWQPERLTAGWTFTPVLGIGGLWDSNSTLRVKGDPLIQQWVGLVNPRGELDFNGRRTRFSAGYSGTLEAYQELAELTRYEQRGRLQARVQATPRLQMSLASGFTASPTTERIDLGGLPYENVGSKLFTSRGSTSYALTRRLTVGGEYEFQRVDFDEPEARLQFSPTVLRSGHSHSGSGSFSIALTSLTSAGASYTYRRAFTDGGAQLVQIQDAMGVVNVRLTEHTTVQGGAGYAYLRLLDTGETRTGPSVRASINHTVQRTNLSLQYDRMYVPSWSFGGTTTNEEIRGGVAVPLMSGRLMLSGGAGYRHNEPLLTLGTPIVLDAWSVNGSIGYGIAPWLRVEGFYSTHFQDSSARGEVDRTRVGIQFVTLKPVRIQ